MKTVTVYKAEQTLAAVPVESVTIVVDETMPLAAATSPPAQTRRPGGGGT